MATEIQIQFIEKTVLEAIADEPSLFLVQIKVAAGNIIKVFVDGDEGITIEKCIKINRFLYRQLEEGGIFPADDFALEVSSPGVGEPLILHRQYVKNIGRQILVKMNEGQEIEGDLLVAGDHEITVETVTGKGKKLAKTIHNIPFDNIKSTTVQIKF